MLKTKVILTTDVEKVLHRLPTQIVIKLRRWVGQVSLIGIRYTKKIKGFHDEPLHGNRKGQRSIRLNKAYRAFYRLKADGEIEIIEVFDVNKHKY